MPKKKINVAVIGCGYFGPNHIRNYDALDEIRHLWCCDSDKKKLKSLKFKFPHVKVTENFKKILKDKSIDAVSIVTPASTHYQIARTALEAGKHTFVEKPMAMNTLEARELVELAKKRKKVLMAGHTFEYNPAVNYIKKQIATKKLGKVLYFSFKRVNLGLVRSDVNVVWNLAPHDISISLFLKGEMPCFVRAVGTAFLRKGIEDLAHIELVFPDGSVSYIQVSWLDPNKIREMVVVGSKKMLVYDDLAQEGKVKIFNKSAKIKYKRDRYGVEQVQLKSGDIVMPHFLWEEPLKLVCKDFIRCVLTGSKPKVDGQNGLRVVRVLEAAQKSLESRGASVRV